MNRCPDQAGPTPSNGIHEQGACRPANRAGKTGEQRNAGDRIARIAAVKSGDGREGCFIETEAHANAYHHPRQRQSGEAGSRRQQHQACRKHQICTGQHVTTAMPVDHPTGSRTKQSRQQKGAREDTEEPRPGKMKALADRIGHHSRKIVGRSPSERLCNADCRHDDTSPPPKPGRFRHARTGLAVSCRLPPLIPAL